MPRDYAREYQRRIERGREQGFSRGAAAGHARGGEVPVSRVSRLWGDVPTTEGLRGVPTVGGRQARTLGRYEHDLGALARGQVSDRDFRRRWSGKQVGGVALEGDPRKARAMLRERETPEDPYERGEAA